MRPAHPRYSQPPWEVFDFHYRKSNPSLPNRKVPQRRLDQILRPSREHQPRPSILTLPSTLRHTNINNPLKQFRPFRIPPCTPPNYNPIPLPLPHDSAQLLQRPRSVCGIEIERGVVEVGARRCGGLEIPLRFKSGEKGCAVEVVVEAYCEDVHGRGGVGFYHDWDGVGRVQRDMLAVEKGDLDEYQKYKEGASCIDKERLRFH